MGNDNDFRFRVFARYDGNKIRRNTALLSLFGLRVYKRRADVGVRRIRFAVHAYRRLFSARQKRRLSCGGVGVLRGAGGVFFKNIL